MRFHENLGNAGNCKAECQFDIANPTEVNILEEAETVSEKSVMNSDKKQVFLKVKPFEILTLKLNAGIQ